MVKFRLIWLLLPLTLVTTFVFPQQADVETSSARRIIEEIKTHSRGIAVWWTGHNGWLIKADTILIGTDLVLESDERAFAAPVSAAELAPELDISFVTHEHGDHFERETSGILRDKGNCIFVIPANCLEVAQEDVNIPPERIKIAEPRKPFKIGAVYVEPVRAIHGNPKFAVFYDANLENCGYRITVGGKSFLQVKRNLFSRYRILGI